MLDIKLIREQPEMVRENIKRRQDKEKLKALDEFLEADRKWRELTARINELRARRNKLSQEVSQQKKEKKSVTKLLDEAKKIPEEIKSLEAEGKKYGEKARIALIKIPNLLHESVPYGKDDTENVEIRRWGNPPKFDFKAEDHLTILKNLGLIDFETAAKIAGSGFYYLKDDLLLLDLALQRFALNFLMKKGFTIFEPPYMVNRRVYEGMIGDPTDFAEASYKIENEDLYLIPTSEYSVGAIFIDQILNKKDLPVRVCGISPCFRREVGTHGKYAKGLFRVHQFNKVEQFVFCMPEQSWKMHEEIQKNTEEMYQALGLHYRVVNVCTGDLGVKAAKKYDTEVWMADGKFREVGSNSNVTDYQARMLNIRFREKEGAPAGGFVHMLNNTAIATSRAMIGVVEQFQQKDGSVVIPEVLRPFMNGTENLEKK